MLHARAGLDGPVQSAASCHSEHAHIDSRVTGRSGGHAVLLGGVRALRLPAWTRFC